VKRIGFIYLAVFICAILQATLLNYFRLWGTKPDILLLCCVVASLNLSLEKSLCLAVFAGFLKDILSLNHYGISTLFFPVIVFLVFKLSRKISAEGSFVGAILVLCAVILNGVISKIFLEFFGTYIPVGVFLRVLIIEALYSSAVSLVVFKMKERDFFRLSLHPEEQSDEGSLGRNQFN